MNGRSVEDAVLLSRKRIDVEVAFEYRKWVEEIPWLDFPDDWKIRPIPPFSGAVARFLVKRTDTPEGHRVSVYLDCYGELGAWYEPHWEVYPGTEDGDTYRVAMNDTDELMESIGIGLDYLATQTEGYIERPPRTGGEGEG